MNDNSPAFEDAAAAGTWRALIDLTAPVARAPQGPVDWTQMIRLAGRHRVMGRLYETLRANPDWAPKGEAAAAFERAAQKTRLNAMRYAAETLRVCALLESKGVPAAVMKGAVISAAIYGDPTIRDARDVDLLVPPRDVAAAVRHLRDDGYVNAGEWDLGQLESPRRCARVLRATNQVALRHPERRILIEVQWRWLRYDALTKADPDRIWTGGRAALGPAQVLAPDPIEHAAFLFSHGVIHRYARMKWLNDLRMTLHDPAWFGGDWSALMERAGHMRVQRSVVATALLVERLDGTPPPPPVAALATAKARRLAAALHREIEADGPKLTDPGPPTTARAMAAAFWRRYGSADSSGLGAYLRILLTSTSAELNRTDLSRPMESAYYAARIRTLLKIAFRGRQ